MTHPVIGFDASRCFRPHPTGTETYARQILRHLVRHPEAAAYEWRLYVDIPPQDEAADLRPLDHVTFRHLPRVRMWTHRALAREMRRHPPQALFVPAHVIPFVWRPARLPPAVMTIHDLGYEHFPGSHPRRQRLYLTLTTRYAARVARRLICVSEATRHDLASLYGADTARLTVVHQGWTQASFPAVPQAAAIRTALGLTRPYALFLSTLQPRKNVARLIEGYTRLSQRQSLSWDLVLAGKPGWLSGPILEAARNSPARRGIHLLGYVDREQAGALLAGARLFCYPSLYEGFGLPVLEAQAHGVPVMTSRNSSLPEIAGEAALLVDPEDVEEIAQAMLRLSRDEDLRRELIAKGHRNLERFSWDRAAEETLAVIRQAMDAKK